MNAQIFIFVYLLPCSIALMALWLCYRLLFVNSKKFQFNRFFLLTAMLFAFALPLFVSLFSHNSALTDRIQQQWFTNIFLLNEIIVTPNGISPDSQAATVNPTNSTLNLWQLLGIIYLAGVIINFIAFSVKILKLTVLTIRSPKEKKDGYTAVFTSCDNNAFSFLHYVYVPDKNISPCIIRHELSHITHHHSIDVLFTILS